MTTAQSDPVTPVSREPQRKTGTRVWLLLLIAALAAVVWYKFAYVPSPRVALITSGDGPYWDPVIAGAKEAAKDFDVKLVVDRIKSDPFVQADVLKQRNEQRDIDAIAISPLNASIQANLLAEVAATKTLVTLDSDSPVTGRFLFVGTDNYAAGREAGAIVREALPEGGGLIISLGNADKENTQHRRQGVIDELLDRPEEPMRKPDAMDQPIKGEKYTIVATIVDESDPAKATELVAAALKADGNVKCVVGLLGYSIVRIASPAFYALGDSRTPVIISIAAVIANAGLNLALVRVLGYRGLALGTSVAALFNAGALIWFLHRRLDGLDNRRVLSSFARIIVASLVMGLAAVAIDRALTAWIPGNAFAVQAARLFVTILSALLVLALAAHVLRIREFREGLVLIAKRGGRESL